MANPGHRRAATTVFLHPRLKAAGYEPDLQVLLLPPDCHARRCDTGCALKRVHGGMGRSPHGAQQVNRRNAAPYRPNLPRCLTT